MDGFLTCVFEAFDKKEYPSLISKNDTVQLSIGAVLRKISTDNNKAERVYQGLEGQLGAAALKSVYYATLSAEPDAEAACLDFLRHAFKKGRGVFDELADPRVWRMYRIENTVSKETGRWIEFIRFSELEGGILFAEFEPEPNVLPLIMPHFADRLNAIPFIIHDKARHTAGVYDTNEWLIISSAEVKLPEYSDNEQEYRTLWKLFFNTMAIKERINPRLQAQMVPKKYWRHMTEMQL